MFIATVMLDIWTWEAGIGSVLERHVKIRFFSKKKKKLKHFVKIQNRGKKQEWKVIQINTHNSLKAVY